jgi:uncharacterized membrane protein YfcA
MQLIQRLSTSKRTIIAAIALATWTTWLTCLGLREAASHLMHHWQIALTMAFGSLIAGGTSLGGGAVAFPVFTKILHIPPQEAKIFSLAIQSVGMSAASLAICLTRVPVNWRAIRWGSLGGFGGIYLGLGILAPLIPPDALKMSFTLMLASFALTLLALNQGGRHCHTTTLTWGWRERGLFLLAGAFGGIMSGLVGNGIDIAVFSVMVLLFGISEKVATPTSVMLMAVNAVVGFILQVFTFHDFPNSVYHYWLAAIPIVVVGAPLGAMFCSLLRRETIANILIFLIAIEVLTSILLIPLRPVVIYFSLSSLILCSCLNYWMYRTPVFRVPQATNAQSLTGKNN